MPNFIYVFSEQEKDKLLAMKYEMIKCDKENTFMYF